MNPERANASSTTKASEAGRNLVELTELVGGLAHELRNPLSTMMVNLKLLSEYLDDERTPFETVRHRAQQKVDVLRREAERLNNLFDEFLNLTGPSGINCVEADLNGIVQRVAEFFEPEAASRNVRLVLSLADGVVDCRADERLLRQALLNVLINGVEAMPEGGDLTVITRRDGSGAYIDIRDTGVGVREEDRDRIFRPFYSNKARGTGLGLSVTQRIVQDHGGRLEMSSQGARGATFTIFLPGQGEPKDTAGPNG